MKIYNIANAIMADRDTVLLDSSIAHESNAIIAYRDAILQLDSSIICKIYEDDLIFIIAINDDKYDYFEKEINLISFEIHSKFDLEKKIVCIPNDFILDWDTPLDLIQPRIDEIMTNHNYYKYNLNQIKGVANGCAAA